MFVLTIGAKAPAAVQRALSGGKSLADEAEFKTVRADGEMRWLLDRGQAVQRYPTIRSTRKFTWMRSPR